MGHSGRWRLGTAIAAVVALTLGAAAPAGAYSGDPDATFGAGGAVLLDTSNPGALDAANAMTAGYYGDATLAGEADGSMAVARTTYTGEIDARFGHDGIVRFDFGVPSVAHGLADTVAVGEAGGDFAAAAIDAPGNPRRTFGVDGKVRTSFGAPASASAALHLGGDVIAVGRVGATTAHIAMAAYRVDGTLDPLFGSGGTRTFDVTPDGDNEALAITYADPSGQRAYVAGRAGPRAFVARIHTDGSLDTSWGAAGVVLLDASGGADAATGLAWSYDDGRLTVVGSSGPKIFAARLNEAGTMDASFGQAGLVVTDFGGVTDVPRGVALDRSTGKVTIAGASTRSGQSDGALLRLTAEGAKDTTFGATGVLLEDFGGDSDELTAIGISGQAGNVMAAGSDDSDMVVLGAKTKGDLSATARIVLDSGRETYDAAAAAVPTTGGGTVVVLNADAGVVLVRLDESGNVDSSFGLGGVVVDELGTGYAVAAVGRPDGGFDVVVSETTDVGGGAPLSFLVRYRADGSRYATVGRNGIVELGLVATGGAVLLQPDETLLVGGQGFGYGQASVARVLPSGVLDPTFGDRGVARNVCPFQLGGMVVKPGGGVALFGSSAWHADTSLCGITASGAVDGTHNSGTYPKTGSPVGAVRLPDGRAVVLASRWVGLPSPSVAVLSAYDQRGVLDRSFGTDGLLTLPLGSSFTSPSSIAVDGSGRLLVAATTSDGGPSYVEVVRVTAGGDLDEGFGEGGIIALGGDEGGGSSTIAVDASQRIVLAGYLGGDGFVARLSGSPDHPLPPPPPPPPSPTPTPAPPVAPPPPRPNPTPTAPAGSVRSGYWMVGADGAVYAFGGAAWAGNAPVGAVTAQDLEPTPSGSGYWIVDAAGHVFAFGDAAYHGGTPPLHAGELVTSLSRTAGGSGYWLFTTLGRVFAYGNAPRLGDMSGTRLNGPVLDSIPTPSGKGYFMVASDGGIFTFGDAAFEGSMGGTRLNQPVQSLVPDPDGVGYWLVASDGGIFAFAADFYGSMGAVPLNRPVTGMVGYGHGYLMVAEDGGIFTFGDAPFEGSLGSTPPRRPITSVAARL